MDLIVRAHLTPLLLVFISAVAFTLQAANAQDQSADAAAYDAEMIAALAARSKESGNPARGAVLFSSPTSACLSCHKVGPHGGDVGLDLSKIGAQRKPVEIVESLLFPQRTVAEPYKAIAILTVDGLTVQGYRVAEDGDSMAIRDAASGKVHTVPLEEIEAIRQIGSLMPTGLLANMSEQDRMDLVAFLYELGNHQTIGADAIATLLSHAHGHHPASFEMPRTPLHPEAWPSWQADVNRDRVYDFYRKQARHYRAQNPRPHLLEAFPGLDGGGYGHWGNQSEPVWADDRWNETDLGSLLSGVFRGGGTTVARGVCVRISDDFGGRSVCFDPDTLCYPSSWSGGFVSFSEVRHGFMHGLNQDGPDFEAGVSLSQPAETLIAAEGEATYLGFYRHGPRVVFAYQFGDTIYLDTVVEQGGKIERIVAPIESHPDRQLLAGGPRQWPQQMAVQGKLGSATPFSIDTIPLPKENPWKALVYCGGHDFLSDGSALVCTMQGDVWHATGIDEDLKRIVWRRFASGLHQPLGLLVEDDEIFVVGRDQITRLHDLNDDGEADFYECYSQALSTSKSGHDFTCGIQRDAEGRFYTASGAQGVMRVSRDGNEAEVLATGLRNSDGIGITPSGLLTIPSSEGDWTPASMIAAVRVDGAVLNRLPGTSPDFRVEPFFGRPGAKRTQPPEVPMLYMPRGLDNSSGGQVYIDSDQWGSLKGRMVHLSFGGGRAFLLLRDQFGDWIQAAAVPIDGEFLSGVHRGRFNPADGQLYVSGMAGWGTYTTDDGCFQRLRMRDQQAQMPVGFHVHQNGVVIEFAQPLDPSVAQSAERHFAQAWNYRYSGAYGSPEYSHRQLGLQGHDVMEIHSATVLDDPHRLFLEIPDLQLVSQLHLLVQVGTDSEHDLFLTVNRMDADFESFPGYQDREKVLLPHPMLNDIRRPTTRRRNPNNGAIADARAISISAARNLNFDQSMIEVEASEPIRLTFNNPDAVPHNWALLKSGTLQSVGRLCNELIADPDAMTRHYIPDTDDVLVYTDVVDPYSSHTIYFRAPKAPGRYPYVCTFPGHWMVMNGTLVVK